MRRVLFASGILVLLVVVVVTAQPPVAPPLTPPAPSVAPPGFPPSVVPPGAQGDPVPPAPPKPFPGVPGAPSAPMGTPSVSAPVAAAEAPLSKFTHIETFPQNTQFAVRGSLMAAEWLAKMGQPHGRFLQGYLPALRQPMSGDHDLRQAQAALAMAQAAKFSGDQKHAAIASQAVLALLASTKVDANDPNSRAPVQMSFVCNRVGFAALVALAIVELPNPSDKLLDDAERLCAFLRTQLRADGSVHYADNPADDPTKFDPAGFNEYPGLALHALAASNRVRPADWKKDAVKKGVAYYHTAFRAKPHPALVATVTPAATELYLQTKSNEAATAVFEMNDWLCALQITGNDQRTPQWAGGFRTVADGRTTDAPPSATDTGRYIQSLACAYHLTRVTGDLTHEEKYRPALTFAVQFLYGLQFLETNTRHFEDNFRAKMLMGAFHLSPTDGNLRIDASASAITGLLRFLSCGAER
ncbi:hypothetical protein J8F10_16120 [Gemmata sp. G18]|uniref:Uncharacterized protein n=1 Tax=Gemmata palustris TaxID=2822762 RepID=A0ABS5BSU2_9BACT|nr:hypothetical protein [Gemmata palustris]MBP3956800.1 hypothetical protein [Gemmata palustris]